MNAAPNHDAIRLRGIRAALDAIAPGQWSRACDGAGEFLEARGAMGELLPLARFDAGASLDEILFIADAPENVRFLIGLIDRAIERHRREQGTPSRQEPAGDPQASRKNFAAEAAMKCGEPSFLVFLEEKHGLERPLTQDRATVKLRGILGVASRNELNDDDEAAARWKALRGDFENWKRAGR